MKRVYKQPFWRCLFILFLFILLGVLGMVIPFEEDMKDWIMAYIIGPLCILSGIALFQGWRSFAITIEDEFISKNEELKIRGKNLGRPEFVRIKWEDIIAIYMIKTSWPYSGKSILIFPKANTGDKKQDEMIDLEVRQNKNSKVTETYADWLIVNKKGIKIPKSIKNYCDLLKEIHRMAPQAVIDDEIKKLIEK